VATLSFDRSPETARHRGPLRGLDDRDVEVGRGELLQHRSEWCENVLLPAGVGDASQVEQALRRPAEVDEQDGDDLLRASVSSPARNSVVGAGSVLGSATTTPTYDPISSTRWPPGASGSTAAPATPSTASRRWSAPACSCASPQPSHRAGPSKANPPAPPGTRRGGPPTKQAARTDRCSGGIVTGCRQASDIEWRRIAWGGLMNYRRRLAWREIHLLRGCVRSV
jgi:hypothetical protein